MKKNQNVHDLSIITSIQNLRNTVEMLNDIVNLKTKKARNRYYLRSEEDSSLMMNK